MHIDKRKRNIQILEAQRILYRGGIGYDVAELNIKMQTTKLQKSESTSTTE